MVQKTFILNECRYCIDKTKSEEAVGNRKLENLLAQGNLA